MKTTRIIIASLALLLGLFTTIIFINDAADQQERKTALAELKHIQYDLFNPESWKEKIADILTKKISELDLSGDNRTVLKEQIEKLLYAVLDEVDKIIHANDDTSIWGVVKYAARTFVADVVFDIQDLRNRVPDFADALIEALDDPKNREMIRDFLLQKISSAINDQFGRVDLKPLERICTTYGYDYPCEDRLASNIRSGNEILWMMTFLILFLATLIFGCHWKTDPSARKTLLTLALAICSLLLVAGVSTPMIDIDARISHFEFEALGETVSFGEQVLFFQSKSITDVVGLLFDSNSADAMTAGFLIFLFSIIFPVGKIISTFILLWMPSVRSNRMLGFFAFRSGKWSMADVMVVAIFMAFLGFRGLINSQLQNITGQLDSVNLFTTNDTSLQPGFILFVAFCMFSLILSKNVEKHLQST